MKIKLPQTNLPSKRLYFILLAIIGLLVAGLAAGAYGANNLLDSQANTLLSLKAKSQALDQEQLSLAGAKKEVKTYSSLEQTVQTIVPEDKDQAEAVREIVDIAAANNVSLAAINFPASTLGSTTPGTANGVGATSSAGTTTTPAAVNLNSSTIKLSQLVPVANIPGVYDLQITLQGDPNKPVQYTSFINFLSALEHNRRTAQISAITLQPSTNNPDLLTFTLTLNEYIKP